MTNFYDSNKRTHDVLGYEVTANQHMEPHKNGWFLQSYGNTYSMNEMRVSIRHYYGINDRARWTVVYKYRHDRHYTIEVYDTVQVDHEFYNRTVYNDIAYNLREAVHLANLHKSDK